MKIQSIQLRHTYHFSDLTLNFSTTQKPITLIIGDCSSGKTAIIKNIYQALTWFPARLKDLRTAGVVMLDQDIMNHRVQSKINIQVSLPIELDVFTENIENHDHPITDYSWQLYKTLNSTGIGLSKVETQALEQCVGLYLHAIQKDQLQGLPLIAYYPSERFVNEMNILSKNNPAIFQTAAAYETSSIPFTTFSRFFEWFREISDIENAQTAQLFQKIMFAQQQDHADKNKKQSNPSSQNEEIPLSSTASSQQLEQEIYHSTFQAQTQIHSPNLQALKTCLNIVIPELTDFYLEYHPKLQLMVRYNDQTMLYQQLSNSLKNWIALVGDIVRRLCLLNPFSLFPCIEGDGILLIDDVDTHLDQNTAETILSRLHDAFPRLQIIATGNRVELLESTEHCRCLKLEDKKIQDIQPDALQQEYDHIFENLLVDHSEPIHSMTDVLQEPNHEDADAQKIYKQFQNMTTEQQIELRRLLQEGDDQNKTTHEPLL